MSCHLLYQGEYRVMLNVCNIKMYYKTWCYIIITVTRNIDYAHMFA